jgi:hypothetical protein
MRRTMLAAVTTIALLGAAAPTAGAQYTDYRQSAGDQYHQPSGQVAKAKVCVSNRRVTLTLRLRSASVTMNGRRLRVRRTRGGKLAVTVDMRGRRAGLVTIRVRGKTLRGRRVRQTRRFMVCAGATAGARPRTVVVADRASATTAPSALLGPGAVLALLGTALLGAGSLFMAGRRIGRRQRR